MMYLARRCLDDHTVWLHLIDDHELFAARSVDCAGMQVKRVPHAWDWRGGLGRGVSAIGNTEEQALALLAERVRLVAEIDAAPEIGHERGRPRDSAPDGAAVGHVPRKRLALARHGR